MKSFLKYTLATIAGILVLNFLGLIIFFIIVGLASGSDEPTVLDNTVLVADFSTPILDRSNDNPFNVFSMGNFTVEGSMGLDQVLKNIHKAKADDDISGIFLNLSAVPVSMATLGEIRNALIDFKESGKFILAHSDFYTQKSYYLATVADSIYLTPTGELDFKGLSSRVLFFKRALDKYGVDVQVIKHGTYKSAVEPFLTDKMSDANKEQLEVMLGSIWGQMIGEISVSRDISVDDLNSYADDLSVAMDKQALEKGMVDGLKYYDEVLTELKERTDTDEDDDIPAISIKKYSKVSLDEKKEASKDKIAVIYAMGAIVMGNADEGFIGADRISRAIRDARNDKRVKAIVFRVNSGGGGVLASEIIHREISLAAEVKPVVASMGSVAASGGYYIVAPADTIVASETTITGSIGVFAVLPNLQGFMQDKIGITTGVVRTNKHADMGSPLRALTGDERTIFQSYVDDTYVNFVNRVAEGRSMSYEEVDAIGGGRVWSGINAMEIGLIDVYGGLEKAIDIAAEMAGLENYRLSSLPVLEDPFTMLMNQISGGFKVKILKKELGASYEIYKQLEEINSMEGIQARMPYTLDIY